MKNFKILISAFAVSTAFTVSAAEVPTVDFTANVQTSKEAWHGTGTYNNVKVNTADGRNVAMVEHYYQDVDVPAGEKPLYQTVTVENGKYHITLYATANNAWKGDSWLSSDSQDAVQVYARSGENTVSTPMTARKASGFTEADEYSMVIDVTDGTLELGMENLIKNQAEWFTIQIKSLTREVSEQEALDAAKAEAESILADEKYANVTGNERSTLSEAASGADLTAINAALSAFKDAKTAYDSYAESKAEAETLLDDCLASASVIETLQEKLNAAAPADATDAVAASAAIMTAIPPVVWSNAIAEGFEARVDCTDLIINPIPSNTSARWTVKDELKDGWYLAKADGNANMRVQTGEAPAFPDGTTPAYYDTDNWSNNDWTSQFSQKINLPEGKYRLALAARGSDNLGWYQLYANDSFVDLKHHGGEGGIYGRGWEENILDFESTGGETVISVWGRGNGSGRWESFTNFRLTRISTKQTSIGSVEAADNSEHTIIYDLFGRRVENPTPGFYIVNGKKTVIR